MYIVLTTGIRLKDTSLANILNHYLGFGVADARRSNNQFYCK